jgi:hypothetical protein
LVRQVGDMPPRQFVACGADSRVHSPLIIAAAACSYTGARMFRGQRDVT